MVTLMDIYGRIWGQEESSVWVRSNGNRMERKKDIHGHVLRAGTVLGTASFISLLALL